ncbi:tetratricopeptide repeat protein [Candidatus Uhrbacteria bacterium]|nr:tetratricopeptide repeat protein [Candidatus Uhrbacteria bacterium]
MKIEKILQAITFWSLTITALILPLFFLPITTEWLEWNKHYLLGLAVVIALLAWLGQGMVTKKLTIGRSPLDVPFGIWWLLLLVAAILSKDRLVSFFGLSENVSGGFLSVTFLLFYAFLVISNVKGERIYRFLMFLGMGGGLAAVYFWLGRLGAFGAVSRWVPRWNPTTDLNAHFGIAMVLALVFSLGILLVPRLGRNRSLFWSVLAGLFLITVVAIGFKTMWIALGVGCFLLLLFALPRMGEVRQALLSLFMVLFVLSIVFAVIGTPSFLTVRTPTEITLAQARSFQITVDTLKEGVLRTLFGSGPDTFIHSFTEHRPVSYNLSPTWAIRFSRPAASSYQILGGAGILGTIAFLVVMLVGMGAVLQGWQKSGGGLFTKIRRKVAAATEGNLASSEGVTVFFAVAAAWLTSLVMLFLVAYSMTLWFLFFTLLALLPTVGVWAGLLPERARDLSLKATPQYALATSFVYVVIVAVVALGGIFLGRFYAGEVLAVKAIRAAGRQDFDQAERQLQKAMILNPYRPEYPLRLARVFLQQAAVESRKEKPDVPGVGLLVGKAINSSLRATKLSPRSAGTWEQLAQMYANARPFSREANGWVINSLNQAIEIEPMNARLYLSRGNIYRADKKLTEAEADARKAVELKANYASAHYALSVILEQKKDLGGAVEAARAAVRSAPRAIDAQFNLGRLLYNRNAEGDEKEAEAVFRRILAKNKDYANALFSLGLLLERQDKIAEARAFYERVAELDPLNTDIKDRLRRLGSAVPSLVEPEPEELPEEEETAAGEE